MAKKKPQALTKDGVEARVETRVSETAVVIHIGLVQLRFDPTQARVLARKLRISARTLDPEPQE
ncbi:MAG: hypothetical protein WAZ94_15345 [Phycisphaerales bacterium]|nr:hypothetical protein [Chloroflexota bacterium]